MRLCFNTAYVLCWWHLLFQNLNRLTFAWNNNYRLPWLVKCRMWGKQNLTVSIWTKMQLWIRPIKSSLTTRIQPVSSWYLLNLLDIGKWVIWILSIATLHIDVVCSQNRSKLSFYCSTLQYYLMFVNIDTVYKLL